MGIPLKELLQVPILKRSRVLAGRSGLDHEVEWVDVMDLPDIRPWIRPKTFLLSTFYVIRDDPEAQLDVIRTLAMSGAAGLCLDPHMFLKGVSHEFTQLADQLGVPVVELPEEAGYGELITPLMDVIIRRRRLETDFLSDLLEGKFRTEEFLARRARAINWRLQDRHAVMVVDIDEFEELSLKRFQDEEHIQAVKRTFAAAVEQIVQQRWSERTAAFEKSDSIVLLPEIPTDMSPVEIREGCRALGYDIKAALSRRLPDLSVTVGIGRLAPPTRLWRSYQQAEQAIALGRQFLRTIGVYSFDQVEIYSLLLELERDQLHRFATEQLGALIHYDREKGADFVHTLETYFEHEQNLARTARALFIHRNSLQYRLERIKEILSITSFGGAAALNLALAIKVRRVGDAPLDHRPEGWDGGLG